MPQPSILQKRKWDSLANQWDSEIRRVIRAPKDQDTLSNYMERIDNAREELEQLAEEQQAQFRRSQANRIRVDILIAPLELQPQPPSRTKASEQTSSLWPRPTYEEEEIPSWILTEDTVQRGRMTTPVVCPIKRPPLLLRYPPQEHYHRRSPPC
ncbi:hypothetical protein GGR57DRAFT_509084 [Xylariaceae sp. FL1272]|nr:hypothetical protein GGR57DRAFT_509084 [Xylariaceae sp. FL1272]